MSHDKLFGTWKLISLQFVNSDTDDRHDMYGPDPLGYLVMTRDNRMMTVISSRDRTSADTESGEAALFRSMMAYCGAFRIEGEDQFITAVEAAWHPGWLGTEQGRTYAIEDDILSITTAEISHPMFPGQTGRGVLKWERMSAL